MVLYLLIICGICASIEALCSKCIGHIISFSIDYPLTLEILMDEICFIWMWLNLQIFPLHSVTIVYCLRNISLSWLNEDIFLHYFLKTYRFPFTFRFFIHLEMPLEINYVASYLSLFHLLKMYQFCTDILYHPQHGLYPYVCWPVFELLISLGSMFSVSVLKEHGINYYCFK